MNILHLFSGYNTFSDVAGKYGHNVVTVDIKNYRGCEKQDYLIDFMFFDYKIFKKSYFDFILIGFPCTTFSKASGMFHFIDNAIPITAQAHNSLEMIERMFEILDYFKKSIFLIENPVSALFSNVYYQKIAAQRSYNHFRIYQYNYGHLLAKHTEFVTNSQIIWLDNTIYRKKGKFQKHKIDYISLRKRQSYPLELCERIIDYAEKSIIMCVDRNKYTGYNENDTKWDDHHRKNGMMTNKEFFTSNSKGSFYEGMEWDGENWIPNAENRQREAEIKANECDDCGGQLPNCYCW